VAQDVALSRPKLGFESRWGHWNKTAERWFFDSRPSFTPSRCRRPKLGFDREACHRLPMGAPPRSS